MLAADVPRRPWQVHLLKRSGKGLNPVLAPGGAGAGASTGDWRDSWCAARRTAQAARAGGSGGPFAWLAGAHGPLI
jgi:hypothetical protein